MGDSVRLGTVRDAAGRFLYPAPTNTGTTGPTAPAEEWWHLGAITPHLAVFLDGPLAAALPNIAGGAARLATFAASYDSTVVPLLQAVTTGIPDQDGTGRVVVLVANEAAGGGLALVGTYGRTDCADPSAFVPGEGITLGTAAFLSG